ncbi:hypothetical protein D1872_343640 [compost metagenome]
MLANARFVISVRGDEQQALHARECRSQRLRLVEIAVADLYALSAQMLCLFRIAHADSELGGRHFFQQSLHDE